MGDPRPRGQNFVPLSA